MTEVEVIQDDRDAARAFWEQWADYDNAWLCLSLDEQECIVQAFARHRLKYQPTPSRERPDIERLK